MCEMKPHNLLQDYTWTSSLDGSATNLFQILDYLLWELEHYCLSVFESGRKLSCCQTLELTAFVCTLPVHTWQTII